MNPFGRSGVEANKSDMFETPVKYGFCFLLWSLAVGLCLHGFRNEFAGEHDRLVRQSLASVWRILVCKATGSQPLAGQRREFLCEGICELSADFRYLPICSTSFAIVYAKEHQGTFD